MWSHRARNRACSLALPRGAPLPCHPVQEPHRSSKLSPPPLAAVSSQESPERDDAIPGFREVPRTGVIFVVTEAARRGYSPLDPAWSNLGQGMPETGPFPGGPPRVASVAIDPADLEYAPVAGILELREAVAALYNLRYRRGLPSQYTAQNVAIAGGGTRRADACGSRARPGEPRAFSSRLHGLRRAARRVSHVHLDPHPARA